MYALIDRQSIIVTEGAANVVVGAADPTYEPVRRYLVDEQGDDFAAVRELVATYRASVKAGGCLINGGSDLGIG